MSASRSFPEAMSQFVRFLDDETRAFPGRTNVTLRCVLTSAIVITVSMALQVPFLALSLIAVFYITQSNVVVTRLIGVLFMVGSTLAIGCAILVLKFTYDYPLLRIVLSAALFFGSVYLMRVAKIGVVFFLVGLVVIYVQSFVDLTDQAEALVRIALWVWIAINYAIAVTLIINTLLLPAEPMRQLEDAMLGQLKAVDAVLADLERGAQPANIPGARAIQRGILTLQKLLRFATMRDPEYRQSQAFHLARVATVSRLYAAAAQLADAATQAPAHVVTALRGECGALASSIRTGGRFAMPTALDGSGGVGMPGALLEMQNALHAFADRAAAPDSTESPQEKGRRLVPDAFSNPVYAQFALKTTLAALMSYVFYLATDWQGIHTIMLSCLIVAQPSLGATSQRAILRVAGAAIGSALALAMIVWVVPRIDDIVGLLLMALPVLGLSAWVAAGSERISYAGVQLMFTFSLALLEQFGPVSELTEIRDRMIGIVLGIAVSAVVHAFLWPEAEGESLRQRAAGLLHRLAAYLRQADAGDAMPAGLWAELGDCEATAARVALEPGWQMGNTQEESFTVHVQTMLAQTREILLATDAFDAERRAQSQPVQVAHAVTELRDAVGVTLDRYASDLIERPLAVCAPACHSLDARVARWPAEAAALSTDAERLASGRMLIRARSLMHQVSTLPAWGNAPTGAAPITPASQA